ncbi:MAG: hypothetical protein INR71_10135, partial [Terriglobus roseus]|nr:hypothetical protein [Terriglobus roseus]
AASPAPTVCHGDSDARTKLSALGPMTTTTPAHVPVSNTAAPSSSSSSAPACPAPAPPPAAATAANVCASGLRSRSSHTAGANAASRACVDAKASGAARSAKSRNVRCDATSADQVAGEGWECGRRTVRIREGRVVVVAIGGRRVTSCLGDCD